MEYEVKNVRRSKGSVLDLDLARVFLKGGMKIDVTYDRNAHNLIVHQWYALPEDEYKALRAELEKFFESRLNRSAA